MPTGYTRGVRDGTVTDFSEYALQCASAFGALVLMRDDPIGEEIPEFVPSDDNSKALEAARNELAELLTLSSEQVQQRIDDEHERTLASRKESLARIAKERDRYEAMLVKAKAFRSPSPDHDVYAAFLVTQLEESIKWDCDTSYYDTPLVKLDVPAWVAERVKQLSHDIDCHTRKHAKEVERTNQLNELIRQLKSALSERAK